MSALVLSDAHAKAAEKMNEVALASKECQGMADNYNKVIMVAQCMYLMRQALSGDIMRPLMDLQGSRNGFKTDRDSKGGYNEEAVRNAVADATMSGLLPIGNQFNIIANNMYVTKEGFTYLLANMEGLSMLKIKSTVGAITEKKGMAKDKSGKTYERIFKDAEVKVNITCSYKEVSIDEELILIVRVNDMMGHDAILGKADRKAKAWLYNFLTGSAISEGDVEDLDAYAMPEMRNVTPAPAADKPARVSRGSAAGGLRAAAAPAPAPVKPTPAPVAQNPAPSPVPAPASVPVGEELDISVPESDSAASPAVAVSSSAAPAPEDDERGVKLCHAFCREIERAWKAGHKQASVMEVINWMKAYMGMTDIAAPVEGMPWVMAIDMLVSNHAVAFDRVFGTSFAQWKGVPEA